MILGFLIILALDYKFEIELGWNQHEVEALPSSTVALLGNPPSVILAPSSDFCRGYRYLVVVFSKANDIESRKRVRRTYGSLRLHYNFTIIFPLGTSSRRTNQAILLEQNEFGDILQTAFTDTYHNLPVKMSYLLN
ncbi:unnamed protein product [Cylicocyclus nassatus]|uniref:Hexosyltransferase n=1 Tax=Cylicocyclus nassatus TaxID=53992 RepID=A0AA36M343_CYLNA|nr:unnamed protein product [Cylicocyclus nassatus]